MNPKHGLTSGLLASLLLGGDNYIARGPIGNQETPTQAKARIRRNARNRMAKHSRRMSRRQS